MAKIKVKTVVSNTIKTLKKGKEATIKTTDSIAGIKDKSEIYTKESSPADYLEKVKQYHPRTFIGKANKFGLKSFMETKNNIKTTVKTIKNVKNKISNFKATRQARKEVKIAAKEAKKILKKSMNRVERVKNVARSTYSTTKKTLKITISIVKNIILGTKALIYAIVAGGWVVIIVIIVICLIGFICGSVFGIFLSGEKISEGEATMKTVISECNQELSDKLQEIRNNNPHDEFVLDGSQANWKDILGIYTVMQAGGYNSKEEVVTMNDEKKAMIKKIFWDMNIITFEIRNETVTERGVNSQEAPKQVQKKVLHIIITSKSAEQMRIEYNFNSLQNNQLTELLSDEYSSLWSNVIYGIKDSGEYINWKQSDPEWSNVRIGNTSNTIGDIGCLITSIAILIQKSGIETKNITPFNPGTFVEVLNKNNGFDNSGNILYTPITKLIPEFKYSGNINLRNKSKEEKLKLITEYFNNGYYLTAEVKGATIGNQHWVAIVGINGSDVIMADPASNQTIMWNAYEFSKTSQFNYFSIKK